MEDLRLKERYPAAYRRIRSWMEAHPDRAVTPSELVRELGFITREEVIRRILDGADWAGEDGDRYRYSSPDGGRGRGRPDAKKGHVGKADPQPERDPLADRVRVLLERESAGNRIGVSATYLRRLCGNPPDADMRRILEEASWAAERYGFYRYVPVPEESRTEQPPADCAQISMLDGEDSPGIIVPGINAPGMNTPTETAPDEKPGIPQPPAEIAPEPQPDPESRAVGGPKTSEGCEWVQLSIPVPDDGAEELRVGTVLKVRRRARYLSLTVDFGTTLGKASAKGPIVPEPEKLLGEQVVCGVKMTGGKRDVRVKGIGRETGAVAVVPTERVRDGERVESVDIQ